MANRFIVRGEEDTDVGVKIVGGIETVEYEMGKTNAINK